MSTADSRRSLKDIIRSVPLSPVRSHCLRNENWQVTVSPLPGTSPDQYDLIFIAAAVRSRQANPEGLTLSLVGSSYEAAATMDRSGKMVFRGIPISLRPTLQEQTKKETPMTDSKPVSGGSKIPARACLGLPEELALAAKGGEQETAARSIPVTGKDADKLKANIVQSKLVGQVLLISGSTPDAGLTVVAKLEGIELKMTLDQDGKGVLRLPLRVNAEEAVLEIEAIL